MNNFYGDTVETYLYHLENNYEQIKNPRPKSDENDSYNEKQNNL